MVLQPAMTLETEVPVGSVHRWQRRMAALLFLDLIPDRLDSAPSQSFLVGRSKAVSGEALVLRKAHGNGEKAGSGWEG
jgi:hypothetical protein